MGYWEAVRRPAAAAAAAAAVARVMRSTNDLISHHLLVFTHGTLLRPDSYNLMIQITVSSVL